MKLIERVGFTLLLSGLVIILLPYAPTTTEILTIIVLSYIISRVCE